MINYTGMKAEAGSTKYPMLPEGGYVAVVKAVKIEGSAPAQRLVIRLDVSEGEQKGYFTNRYNSDKAKGGQYEVKYKGDYSLLIPNDQNANDAWPMTTLRRFNDMIWRFEGSNPGYHWDGDETKLVGKTIGINMQLGTYNDSEYTKIGRLEIADDVRAGKVQPMKPAKPHYSDGYDGGAVSTDPQSGFTDVSSVDVPF